MSKVPIDKLPESLLIQDLEQAEKFRLHAAAYAPLGEIRDASVKQNSLTIDLIHAELFRRRKVRYLED